MTYRPSIVLALILAIALLSTACRSDRSEIEDDSAVDGSYVSLELPFDIAGTSLKAMALRAGETEPGNAQNAALRENKIEYGEYFLFKSDGSLFIRGKLSKVTDQNAIARIPYDSAEKLQGQNLDVVVVVNYKDKVTGATELPNNITTIEQLQRLQFSIDLLNSPFSILIPMVGKGQTGPIQFPKSYFKPYRVPNPIKLERTIAKVRLLIKAIDVSDHQNNIEVKYHLKGTPTLQLVNGTDKSYIDYMEGVVDDATMQGSDIRSVDWRTFPSLTITNDLASKFGKSDNQFISSATSFYSAPRDWSSNGDEPYLLLKANLYPEGSPSDEETYTYKIPIYYRGKVYDDVPEAELHKMRRNHLYQIETTINRLGGLDGEPVEIDSKIAIEPWIPVEIDANLHQVHYLSVDNENPKMTNDSIIHVQVQTSDPIEVEFSSVYYDYYDTKGVAWHVTIDKDGKVVAEGKSVTERDQKQAMESVTPWDGAKFEVKDLGGGKYDIIFRHSLPKNYVPWHFKINVVHTGYPNPLSKEVHVEQYPPIYVTGERNKLGFAGGTSESFVDGVRYDYADFRYHTGFGQRGQNNWVLYRVTILVPPEGFILGDPTDPITGETKMDEYSNKFVAPEFILASQWGVSQVRTQYPEGKTYPLFNAEYEFDAGYGPRSGGLNTKVVGSDFPYEEPYITYEATNFDDRNVVVYPYKSAYERSKTYFEGEYGKDGIYTEYYRVGTKPSEVVRSYDSYYDGYVNPFYYRTREVKKTFYNKGSWRLPSSEELRLLVTLSKAKDSPIKSILKGWYYWTAEQGKVINTNTKSVENAWSGNANYTRLIFDTWKLKDEKRADTWQLRTN